MSSVSRKNGLNWDERAEWSSAFPPCYLCVFVDTLNSSLHGVALGDSTAFVAECL